MHGVLGGSEQSLVDETIKDLNNNKDTSFLNGYQEDPSLYDDFILKQAIDDYQKINATVAATAKAAASKLNQVATMNSGEKQALIAVFEKYQTKFTNLENGISEDKLKKYLTDNYDTLKDLEIDNFPSTVNKTNDITTINGKKKEELITLAVAARDKLNEKISEGFDSITISPKDKKDFLKKYIDIDFSDSGKSIGFIKGLTDKELLLFNKWKGGSFYSRDFIIRELSQHKLSLQEALGVNFYSLSNDPDIVSGADRQSLLKKFAAVKAETNPAKKKAFINGLTYPELIFFISKANSRVCDFKKQLLETLDKSDNQAKTLGAIFEVDGLSTP